VSKTQAGWDAALEWAARMIEAGYPPGSPPPDAAALAMTIRAKKGDADLVLLGVATAEQVFRARRRAGAPEAAP
jgi:hypothetical protein